MTLKFYYWYDPIEHRAGREITRNPLRIIIDMTYNLPSRDPLRCDSPCVKEPVIKLCD